ncbi:MAG: DUF4826 family protein [Proteobacteria bacterium]|nr:DUF4826 family protein [Pseudomonadota bacterium]
MKNVDDELQQWIRKQLDSAVKNFSDNNVFEDALIEVKPAWVLPSQLLVGKVREQSDSTTFRWFICGDVPLDHMGAQGANSPREVIRYFAMKWQLDAENLDSGSAKETVDHAEALHTLADDERFWK